jgi:hypothetical protein
MFCFMVAKSVHSRPAAFHRPFAKEPGFAGKMFIDCPAPSQANFQIFLTILEVLMVGIRKAATLEATGRLMQLGPKGR